MTNLTDEQRSRYQNLYDKVTQGEYISSEDEKNLYDLYQTGDPDCRYLYALYYYTELSEIEQRKIEHQDISKIPVSNFSGILNSDMGRMSLNRIAQILDELSWEEVSQMRPDLEYPENSATLLLGDIYFNHQMTNHWDKAYDAWTRESMPVFSRPRKENFLEILNFGKYNKRILIMSAIFFILSLVFTFALLPQHGAFQIVTCILEAVVLGYGFFRHKKSNFASLNWMLPALFLLWAAGTFLEMI